MNILITGGASGLGEAITRRLAAGGADKVFFTYNRSEEKARAIEAEFENASAIQCDFTDETSLNSLVNLIPSLDLSVLINNAWTGTFIDTHFHKTRVADFATGFSQNILPTISTTQAAINAFRKKKSGKIITILTAALSETPPIGSSVYVASKAYLQKLTEFWGFENSKYNITSNAVSPSLMLTGLTASIDERLIEQMTQNQPLLTTTEVAEKVAFLIDAGPEVNGTNMVINSATNSK